MSRPEWPTLSDLGARSMSGDELRELAEYLSDLSRWAAELRLIRLAREREAVERVPNRPTIGYYLRLREQREKSA
jgi:hypothetical protein